MSDLITQIAVLENEMKNIAKKVDEGFSANSKEHQDIVALFERAMEKKADRWVQNVIVWVGSVVGVAILGALMSLILIK
jgi:uncharacterized membrane protein YoaK (UPF0700 family)